MCHCIGAVPLTTVLPTITNTLSQQQKPFITLSRSQSKATFKLERLAARLPHPLVPVQTTRHDSPSRRNFAALVMAWAPSRSGPNDSQPSVYLRTTPTATV